MINGLLNKSQSQMSIPKMYVLILTDTWFEKKNNHSHLHQRDQGKIVINYFPSDAFRIIESFRLDLCSRPLSNFLALL